MTDTFLKTVLVTFGIFAAVGRLIFSAEPFFYQHDMFVTMWIIFGIIALVLGLTFLIASVVKGIKKSRRRLLIFAGILLIVFLFPFEYVFGWTLHQFNGTDRNQLMSNLKSGRYDSLISKNEYPQYGTWVSTKTRSKVFKDTSLEMIFIPFGDISSHDYYGTLFISDPAKMNDKRVWDFVQSEYTRKYLGHNWHLIDCYTNTAPAP